MGMTARFSTGPRSLEPITHLTNPTAMRHGPIDFDWVTVPAGAFLMGSDQATDPLAQANELPQHTLYLPAYQIARVPVTVAQFAQFANATHYQTQAEQDGYTWGWTGVNYDKIPGAYWADPRGTNRGRQMPTPCVPANYPVTCVNWQDAVAFCHWAQVRLPTEAEWEKAARGTDARRYPWGEQAPDQERCNFNAHVGEPTPVGSYPKGAGPYGLLDMVGNVWEWTSTLWGEVWEQPTYGYPYQVDDGREDPHAGGYRVLRGGSFSSTNPHFLYMRCAVRYGYDIGQYNYGFRVSAQPASL